MVKADYKNNSAVIEFNEEKTTTEQLVEAVNKTGYSAEAPEPN